MFFWFEEPCVCVDDAVRSSRSRLERSPFPAINPSQPGFLIHGRVFYVLGSYPCMMASGVKGDEIEVVALEWFSTVTTPNYLV